MSQELAWRPLTTPAWWSLVSLKLRCRRLKNCRFRVEHLMLPSLSTSMGISHADECNGTSVPRACTLNIPG